METKSKRNIYINMGVNFGLCMVAFWFLFKFFLDGALYNALLAGDERTWRELAIIYSAVIVSPLIIFPLVQAIRSVWDGSIFDDQFPPRSRR